MWRRISATAWYDPRGLLALARSTYTASKKNAGAHKLEPWCRLIGTYDTRSCSGGFPSRRGIHCLRCTLRRDHAERRRSSRVRAEGRRRAGAPRRARTKTRSSASCACSTSLGIFAEAGPRRFALNPSAELLRKDVPGSLRGIAAFLPDPFHFKVYASLMDSVLTGKPAADTALGMPVFEYLAKNPDYSSGVQRRDDGLQRARRQRGARGLRLQRDRPARGRGRRPRRSADVDPEKVPERARRAHRRRPCHRRREAAHRDRRAGGPLPGRARAISSRRSPKAATRTS